MGEAIISYRSKKCCKIFYLSLESRVSCISVYASAEQVHTGNEETSVKVDVG